MNAQPHQLIESLPVQPTRIAMRGVTNESEMTRLAALFDRARRWERPWEVVSEPHDADCLLVASDDAAELSQWQQHFPREHLIAYSAQPHEAARWHLRRPDPSEMLSPLEFIILLREIGETLTVRKTRPVVASPTRFDWRERLKILFVGSVGSGKTTAVSTLSEVEVISTEAKPTDEVKLQKTSTTVAMDFGYLTLPDGTRLQVYGSPGQRRFDFMSQILIKNALGIVILISNETENPLAELHYYLDCHREFLRSHQAVIGITHCDTSTRHSLDDYRRIVAERGEAWPVIQADARDTASMRALVNTLLNATLKHG